MSQTNAAFVLVTVDTGREQEVIEDLKKIPQIKNIDYVYGNFDLVVKVKVKSMNELQKVLDKIRQMDHIRSTLTMIIRRC